jgi:hypothetical protein
LDEPKDPGPKPCDRKAANLKMNAEREMSREKNPKDAAREALVPRASTRKITAGKSRGAKVSERLWRGR